MGRGGGELADHRSQDPAVCPRAIAIASRPAIPGLELLRELDAHRAKTTLPCSLFQGDVGDTHGQKNLWGRGERAFICVYKYICICTVLRNPSTALLPEHLGPKGGNRQVRRRHKF